MSAAGRLLLWGKEQAQKFMIAKDFHNRRNGLMPLVNKPIFKLIIQNASFKTFFPQFGFF